jgi:prepilin-type N-terminal cleavage/methylation domain-containing protein
MITAIRRRASREEGFTIVECLVAAIILAVGSLAVFTTFVSAIHNVQRSRENQFGVSVAQREMEWVRAHKFSEIGFTGTPPKASSSTEERNPLTRVLPGQTEFSVNRAENIGNTTTFKNKMTFVDGVSSGFALSKEAKFLEGTGSNKEVQATVYRFVLCEESGVLPANCQAKRVVIDVVPKIQTDVKTFQRNYYELQSTIINPVVRKKSS